MGAEAGRRCNNPNHNYGAGNSLTEKIQESLSALLDGEADDREADLLLGRIRDDEALRRLWGRYHMVGDLMRGEKILLDASTLADRVQAHLRDEPAIIAAPRRTAPADGLRSSSGSVTQIAKPVSHAHSWRRIGAGAALAASVAALAVFLSPIHTADRSASPQQIAAIPEPVRTPVTAVDADGNRWKKLPSDVEARLNGYLVQHSDYASGNMVGGMLPYTSVVSYDRNR